MDNDINYHFTCPPAAQAEISPNCWSSLISRLAVCVANRTPVAANGCPIDKDPPQAFHLFRSGSPTFELLFKYFCANISESIAFKLAQICPANASCISHTPMSFKVNLALSRICKHICIIYYIHTHLCVCVRVHIYTLYFTLLLLLYTSFIDQFYKM